MADPVAFCVVVRDLKVHKGGTQVFGPFADFASAKRAVRALVAVSKIAAVLPLRSATDLGADNRRDLIRRLGKRD